MSICVTTQAQVYNSSEIEDSLNLELVASSRNLEEDLNYIRSVIRQLHGGTSWNQIPPSGPDGISGHVAATSAGIHGSTTTATANTLAHRDATGYLRASTATPADDSTIVATTAFVQQAIEDVTLGSINLPPGSIGSDELESGSITISKYEAFPARSILANGSGSSSAPTYINPATDHHVLRRSGTSLGFGQVQRDGIANFAINADKIEDAAVSSTKLASNSVLTAKVQNGAITPQKTSFISQLSATGQLYYGRVMASGIWNVNFPAGWTVQRLSTGRYRITHNIFVGNTPLVFITPTYTNTTPSAQNRSPIVTTLPSYFNIDFYNNLFSYEDTDFSFLMIAVS